MKTIKISGHQYIQYYNLRKSIEAKAIFFIYSVLRNRKSIDRLPNQIFGQAQG